MRTIEMLKNFHNEESGQDLLEYALVLAAVLAAVVAGSTSLSGIITTAIGTLGNRITNTIS
jgi:pilus assembly protein Flp/PilA